MDAHGLGASPEGDPNENIAGWLRTMIEEELDCGPASPPSFTFDPSCATTADEPPASRE